MLEINGITKFAEEDIWEHGCQPDTATSQTIDITLDATNQRDLVRKFMAFCGVDDPDAVELQAAGEPDRIDIAVMENAEGHPATQSQIDDWVEGRTILWYVIYTGYVEKVDREMFSLTPEVK